MPEDFISLKDRDDILASIKMAKVASQGWHDRIETYRKLYAFEQYQDKQGNAIAYQDPSYTNSVDLAVGILLANRMDWQVKGWTPDEHEEKVTSNIEKYLNGILTSAARREDYDVEYQTTFHFSRDGAAAIYSVWDPKVAEYVTSTVTVPDEESGEREVPAFMEPPLRVQIVDPMTVHLLPGGPRRWLVAARITEMSVTDVEKRYGVIVPQASTLDSKQKSAKKGELIDYWELVEINDLNEWKKINPNKEAPVYRCAVRNALIFDKFFIRDPRVMEGYDDLPITVGFFKPVSRTESKDWGHSIMHPMISSVEALSRVVNRRAYQIDVYTDLPLVTKTRNPRRIQVDPGLARSVNLDLNEDIGFPTWPGNSPDVDSQINYFRSKIQQSGFSDVMMASGPNQISGYALSQLGDQNRIRLEQPVRHLKLMWASWAEKALRMTAKFAAGHVVRVYGSTRGQSFADYVQGDGVDQYMVNVIIKPQFPNEEARNHAFASQMRGILSERTIMERYLHIEQADEERERRLQEELLQNPVLKTYAIRRHLRRRAASGDKDAEAVLQQMDMQAMPTGQPGRPEEPTNPTQMSNMPSATGALTPQEGGGAAPGQSEVEQLQAAITAAPKII